MVQDNIKILFVDDEPDILEQAEELLSRENESFDILTAKSAQEALKIFETSETDAVVSDYKMVGINGIEFLRTLREEKDCDTPFIILTGKGQEETAMKALNLGANMYVKKGEDPKIEYRKLAEAIKQEVEHQRTKEREKILHSLLRHDLRNKAQITQGYLELIDEMCVSKEEKRFVKKAMKSIKEGIDLIEKVKTVRKLGEESTQKIWLEPVIRKIIREHREQASMKKIEIEYQEGECKIMGGQLTEEIISNLLENSIKHSEGSKIRVYNKKSDGECVITVEDDGKGIPEKDRKSIFEKGFKMGDKPGSGLGLFLVEEIAKNYGGRVKVKDSELGGVRFDIHLKMAE